ncbi:MAG: thioredoxin domain-containing protein [Polyangiaceae bacterium]|nr:thioredoxin domain-containing protein [Polyangiaceae bacterium]
MRDRILLLLLRLSVLVALVASSALLFDYLGGDAAYCGTVGCLRVRRYGFVGGRIPVPGIGIVAFLVLYALTLARRLPGVARLGNTVAIAGAIIGGLLLLHQGMVVGAFCTWCAVTDVAALVAGGAAGGLLVLERAREGRMVPVAAAMRPEAPEDPLRPGAWVVLGLFAVALPLIWPLVRLEPPVPGAIRAYYLPGKINVIELSDFECGPCRTLHPRLTLLLKEYGDRAHHVRLHAPLEGHAHSFEAATAAVCAEQQDCGEGMANALFSATPIDADEIDRLAAALGVDQEAFQECRSDPDTVAQVRSERALLELGGMPMTPKLYVGGARIVGAQSDLVLRDAFERAARGHDRRGIPPLLFGGLVAVAAAMTVIIGLPRRRRRSAAAPSG